MNRTAKTGVALVLLTGAALTARADVQAEGGRYRLDPVLVAGGGGSASGDNYQLHGSFGQAASATLDASRYRLVGGFWAANPSDAGDVIFRNGFEEDPSP